MNERKRRGHGRAWQWVIDNFGSSMSGVGRLRPRSVDAEIQRQQVNDVAATLLFRLPREIAPDIRRFAEVVASCQARDSNEVFRELCGFIGAPDA